MVSEVFRLVGARPRVLLSIVIAGILAALWLDLGPGQRVPGPGGLALVGRFFEGAIAPALSYEAEFVPEGSPPLLIKAGAAALRTALFAAAAVSLSVVVGLSLGFLGTTAWWAEDPAGGAGFFERVFRRAVAPVIYGATRVLTALMRSVHELIWAVLFLSAMGLTNLAAAIAIAIPYSGTLAKVFSEMIDEAPRDSANALRAAGASPLQVFVVGLLPRALPDLAAYALYRFECGLRSSTVLGFFGIPTLGLYIKLSFENTHYHEVWSYLYTLFGMVLVVEWWSGVLRRRLV